MEKYKSSFIKEKDLEVHVSTRTLGTFITKIVEIEHTPTKIYVSAENDREEIAYKLAVIMIEDKVKELIYSQF